MKLFLAATFSVFGLLYVFAFIWLAGTIHIDPRFAALAGESDFALRFWYFVCVVCPGFLFLGSFVGLTFFRNKKTAGLVSLGIFAASVVVFASIKFLISLTEAPASRLANWFELAFFIVWVTAAWVAAFGVERWCQTSRY